MTVYAATYPVDRSSLTTTRLELDALTVTHARFPSLTSARHAHERAMCTLTLDGAWVQRMGGAAHHCTPGTMLAKDVGETHVDHFEQPGIEVLMIEMEPARARHLEPCMAVLLASRCATDLGITPIARRVARELAEPCALTSVVVEGLVLEMLGTAARLYAARSSAVPPPWVERARELLLATLDRPPRITEVARAVDIHPVRLTRAFRSLFGTSPGSFVRRARLDRAACELISTERTLVDIAHWAGFGDQSHFTRAFKQHTGMSPGRYRLVSRSNRRI